MENSFVTPNEKQMAPNGKIAEQSKGERTFRGFVSTTRLHTRNQELPQWNKGFDLTAVHFSKLVLP